MATVAVSPIVLKDVNLSILSDDYGAHATSVEFVPSASVITIKGLKPEAVFSDVATATWTCNLSIIQDWSETGFSRYLFENEGAEKVVTFTPKSGGPTFTATVLITPGSAGGAVDTFAVATVSLGVKGKPEITDPVTP